MNASSLPITSEPGLGTPDERTVSGAGAGTQLHPGGVAPMIAEASRRLQAVSQRLRTFLQQKLKQFEAVSMQCERIVTQRDSLLRMKDEVLRDKGEWERRRQGQMDELRGEQDRLIEAWQRLEEEQRQILIQHETMSLQGGHVTGSSVDSLMPSFAATVTPAPPSSFESKTGSVFAEPKHFHGPAAVNMSRESALDQFQRLKREIQKHVKRLQEAPCGNGNGNH
jgi:hypothetical protein